MRNTYRKKLLSPLEEAVSLLLLAFFTVSRLHRLRVLISPEEEVAGTNSGTVPEFLDLNLYPNLLMQ